MKAFESLGYDMIRQGSSPRPSLVLTAVPHIGSSSHPPNQKSYFANILIWKPAHLLILQVQRVNSKLEDSYWKVYDDWLKES